MYKYKSMVDPEQVMKFVMTRKWPSMGGRVAEQNNNLRFEVYSFLQSFLTLVKFMVTSKFSLKSKFDRS